MNVVIKQRALRLAEGCCWQCLEPLTRRDDDEFGECPSCGRRFSIRGRFCAEQIPLGPEWEGVEVAQDVSVWTDDDRRVRQIRAGSRLPVGVRFIEIIQEMP